MKMKSIDEQNFANNHPLSTPY